MKAVNLYAPILTDSIVDGEGIRAVIWFQGCPHHCLGCHNPESHKFGKGIKTNTDKLKEEIFSLSNHDGVTFSGGEPFSQPDALLELIRCAKKKELNVWIYTGFIFEDLMEMSKENNIYLEILRETNILVDGKFELENKNLALKFRGSTNQRILDVKKSLAKHAPVQILRYKNKINKSKHTRALLYI